MIPAFRHFSISAFQHFSISATLAPMYITVTHYKGGVGKTTSAVHLAAYFQSLAPTLLIDRDPNRSATIWKSNTLATHATGLPFAVVDGEEGDYHARHYQHIVKDTEARPGFSDFEKLVRGCDLLVIPTAPFDLESEALKQTIAALKQHNVDASRYRVLLVKVPPPPENEAGELRKKLTAANIPIFKSEIPYLKAFKKAFTEGVPVYDVSDPRAARAWDAYHRAGKEIFTK